MALTLTVGTNTYISLTDAEAYVLRLYGRRRDAWDGSTDAVKNSLLAQACLDIDAELWRGFKSSASQTLEFPRNGDATTDTAYDKVEQANVEQALWILEYNVEQREALAAQGVQSANIGGIAESYAGAGVRRLCPSARPLLREWMVVGAAFANG
jgi:hypothetical protein